MRNKSKRMELEGYRERERLSLLCKVRPDGDACRPKRSKAKDRLDGRPVAAQNGLLLSVVQFHKCLLEEKQKGDDS